MCHNAILIAMVKIKNLLDKEDLEENKLFQLLVVFFRGGGVAKREVLA